eukprot:240043_1
MATSIQFAIFSIILLGYVSTADILHESFGIDISGDEGVEKRILSLTDDDGDEFPPNTSYVTVNYKVAKTDNLQIFETERNFEFQIGIGDVICCWDLAIATMSKGESALIRCAPEYGYGDTSESESGIPPGTSLDFYIEMVKWTKPQKPTPTPNKSGRITCGDIYNSHKKNDRDHTRNGPKYDDGSSAQFIVSSSRTGSSTKDNSKSAPSTSPYNYKQLSFYLLMGIMWMDIVIVLYCCLKPYIKDRIENHKNSKCVGYYTASSVFDIDVVEVCDSESDET